MLTRPSLAEHDDLTQQPDIDLNATLADLISRRTQSPIIRQSKEADVLNLLDTRFPQGGESLQRLAAQITHATEQYPRRNTHPGFFGWIAPSGLPTDTLAHAMVAALNENVVGYWSSPVGTTIEKTVVRWLADLVGFPRQSEGLLLSGGSLANMTAIASALAHRFGDDYHDKGLAAFCAPSPPVVLCSAEVHFSIRRAVAMLGIGAENIVRIDTDAQFRMRADKLDEAIQQHDNIVCVVASAGTTNTGALDPLDDIATLCNQHDIWMHVDAAYGGGGLLSPQLKPRYRGIERADSITMDLHKWFYQSLDGSVLLYRDASSARSLFYENADYIQNSAQDSAEKFMFFHIGPELSRRFRALPFYISFHHYGIERLGRNVWHNVQCASYLAEMVEQEKDLELIVAPQLSILCFRFQRDGLNDEEVDRINTVIRDQIQDEGDYLMSATRVHSRPVLRVCVMNHATRVEHIDGLFNSVLRIGRSLV
jgi:aromatic-L-amino-acid decarboxylase